MDILRASILVIFIIWQFPVRAEVLFCNSADELQKSFDFFDSQKDLQLPEKLKLKLSTEISAGCNGAADRFKKIYQCFQKVGVDQGKSIQSALMFAKSDDERVENFIQIFQRLFLEKFFDSDFNSAYKISLELSKDLKTKTKETRRDFIRVVDLCLNDKNFQIGIPRCAKISVEMAKLSGDFPRGISRDFEELYKFVRKDVGLEVDTTLRLLPRILAQGPTATTNFKKTYLMVTKRTSLGLTPEQSVHLAMKISQNSRQETE